MSKHTTKTTSEVESLLDNSQSELPCNVPDSKEDLKIPQITVRWKPSENCIYWTVPEYYARKMELTDIIISENKKNKTVMLELAVDEGETPSEAALKLRKAVQNQLHRYGFDHLPTEKVRKARKIKLVDTGDDFEIFLFKNHYFLNYPSGMTMDWLRYVNHNGKDPGNSKGLPVPPNYRLNHGYWTKDDSRCLDIADVIWELFYYPFTTD